MQRLATTVAIAAWIGFLGVFSIELGVDAIAPDVLVAVSAMSWPAALSVQISGIGAILSALAPSVELAVAAVCLAIVALLVRSLFLLHAPRRANIVRGETLALAGIGCVALLAGAAQVTAVPLLPIDLEGGLVWLALALTLAAIGFDRLVAIETIEERDEDAEFHAGIVALAERMGRQTALYTTPHAHGTDANGDKRP